MTIATPLQPENNIKYQIKLFTSLVFQNRFIVMVILQS